MPRTIPIEDAERDLRGALRALRRGESVTVLDEDGAPMAALLGLKDESERTATQGPDAPATKEMAMEEWVKKMERFAKKVEGAWKGDKSGLEELKEMRERLG